MMRPIPTRAAMEGELEHVLAFREFARSPRLSQFLRFAVNETLEGRNAFLKEYVIGVQVYKRGESYDPRVDPIVRVQASKLRAALASYYGSDGSRNHWRIELPKGAYVPVLRERKRAPWRRLLVAALILTAASATLLAWMMGRKRDTVDAPVAHALTYDAGCTTHPAVSRDGALLAFASDRGEGGSMDIWIRDLRSGESHRLTTQASFKFTPDISPDNRRVVFRSFRADGGIYAVPVGGGPETLLAAGGFSPRYSPDGRWVAYSAVEQSGNLAVYVVPSDGGAPRRIHTQNFSASAPIWTPEGRHLLFLASESENKHDWWVAPFDPQVVGPVPAKSTGLTDVLKRLNGGYGADGSTAPGDWLGREAVFAADGGIYAASFSADWSAVAGVRVILPVLGSEPPRVLRQPDGRRSLIFAQGQRIQHLSAAPLDGKGQAAGELRPLGPDTTANDALYHDGFAISADAHWLAFSSMQRGTERRIVVRDLKTGADDVVTPPEWNASRPLIAPDGRRLIWLGDRAEDPGIFLTERGGSAPVSICRGCGAPRAWSPDGRIVLYINGPDLWSLQLPSGARAPLLKRPGYEVAAAAFSPDGRWLALAVGILGRPKYEVVLAPLDGDLADERRWVPILEEEYCPVLEWSPSGDSIYFLSRRDDFRCLYRQRVHRSDRRPNGPPEAIHHFHAFQRYPIGGARIAVARDRVAISLTSQRSNLWKVDLP